MNYKEIIPVKATIKVGLLSDTHGHVPEDVLKFLSNCNVVFHAGDIGSETVADKLESLTTLVAVHGNIDGREIRLRFPSVQRVKLGGLKLFMTHIAGYPGKYQSNIKTLLIQERPDLVVCGHSHILRIIYDKELQHLHINPGACGLVGWHTRLTAVRFSIEHNKPCGMEIWENMRPRHTDVAQDL
jgi:putative phosphoesterase